ncbi:type VII secretion system-associated protein [uncultured Streptomyces sp.]|uniref:type VII secretion system-associated protein n=1 Tax=uncultured Streptomyces sp. TaxID=174707 RepID=UPI002613F06A|nr:type VII secretion system-associated protein [uncultured Streptomyces sp.]
MADLTHLDSQSLQRFRDIDIADFMADLKAITKDEAGVRALHSLVKGITTSDHIDENPILAIGLMANGEEVAGAGLVTAVKTSAEAIDGVFDAQSTLFKDIDRDLGETIRTLLKTQGTSLTSIDGEALLDIFSDVDSDIGGGSTET